MTWTEAVAATATRPAKALPWWSLRSWRFAFLAAVALAVLLTSDNASAQIHGDVSAQVGVMKRFLAARPPGGAADATIGPIGLLEGHVALLPLVHVGAYLGHDISPVSGDVAARNITFAGLHVRGMVPLAITGLRTWIFGGFGYAGVYEQSYHTTIAIPNGTGGTTPTAALVEGAGGSFFDVPFGIGASYKLRRGLSWQLCGELGGRAGFGHSGSVYKGNGPQLTVPGGPGGATGSGQNATPAGLDRFGLGFTLGVQIDL